MLRQKDVHEHGEGAGSLPVAERARRRSAAFVHEDRRIHDAALRLHTAKISRVPIAPLAHAWHGFDEPAAYAVQRAGWALVGERIAGYKLGYTSAAMRARCASTRRTTERSCEHVR
jgi:hypothetical protein